MSAVRHGIVDEKPPTFRKDPFDLLPKNLIETSKLVPKLRDSGASFNPSLQTDANNASAANS